MYRTVFWTLWEKVRVWCFKRTASKHVYYLGWNRSPAQVGCLRQVLGPGALGRPRAWITTSNWLKHLGYWFSSVQFSHSLVSDSLWLHELQHARPPCPSPTPRVHPNPCPLSQWCHSTISSSVVPFSSCPQSFPASGSFQMSQPFMSGGQCVGVSVSSWVLPMNTQDWSPLGRIGWIFLQSKRLSRVSSNTTVQNHQLFGAQLSL